MMDEMELIGFNATYEYFRDEGGDINYTHQLKFRD